MEPVIVIGAVVVGAITVLLLAGKMFKPGRTAVSVASLAGLHDGSLTLVGGGTKTANEVFSILVDHAGASEDYRFSFVRHWGIADFPTEFPFEGNLGRGGKFWRNGDPWNNDGNPYINCYPEDLTPERERIINEVNSLLAALALRVRSIPN